MNVHGLPNRQGLYDPAFEKSNCGVGFIANIDGTKSNDVLTKGLGILKKLKHRGAIGPDGSTGDGSGIMMQIPHEFFKSSLEISSCELPNEGDYAVGMLFLPKEPNSRLFCEGVLERILKEENLKVLAWREVPVDINACGELAKATLPVIVQVFIDRNGVDDKTFERKLIVVRKSIHNQIRLSNTPYTDGFYICSMSSKTIVYKGLILGYMLDEFYLDLKDPKVKTAISIVHERYSTNTFPSWKLAQPFRYLAHNGEINTIRGNINWMNAREGVMKSSVFGEDFRKILPIISPSGSDSSALDNALELFTSNGHKMEHSIMMLIPEAWQNNHNMDKEKKAYYEYVARLLEPWDGPATVVFTDGDKVGVTLDRNGLRPARYIVDKSGQITMASEVGVVDILPEDILSKGRVTPGEMLLIDTTKQRIISDTEIKDDISKDRDFVKWIQDNKVLLSDIKQPFEVKKMRTETFNVKKAVFGYTKEEIDIILKTMIQTGYETIGSMGSAAPLAMFSDKPQLLYNYFKQNFAQVTNPPIDPIRENLLMSLKLFIGNHGKLLDKFETDESNKYIELENPIISNKSLEDVRHLNDESFRTITIPIVFEVDVEGGLKKALSHLCKRAEESVMEGNNILILSDRNVGRYTAPIPSLIAISAVHHHLINKKIRTDVDLIVETGEARDVMHIALLVGYGAKAVNPYMVYALISDMVDSHELENLTVQEGFSHYCSAMSKGLLKIISRMGISTLQSYCGSQPFQAIGISQNVIDKYFTDTPSRINGLNIEDIQNSVLSRHMKAYENQNNQPDLEAGGEIYKIRNGETLTFEPLAAALLKSSCFSNDYSKYKEFSSLSDNENERINTIRGMLDYKVQRSIPIEEVEPIAKILERFTVSGMSFGSISKSAHESIAIASNRLGATSNSGEGGENPLRYKTLENGDSSNSSVKQIASGRFGVTANYLVNAGELQIKVAQGAKPGEGGHLPGNKVTDEIAHVRHSVPGIDLISPPPHHDIYSIEDLAQLIFDLKNVNPAARVGVKLVAETGVGTVAAGVSKGHADVVMISGYDGGTGASPVSSMKYVGLPWELGLAETQQTLLLNNLRSRIKVQVDGKLKSGRDVIIATLLGAEEYGFATTALISQGCVLCRKCHLNMCPKGIATQDKKLLENFKGKPEYLENYLTFVATEVREIMATLGFKTLDEMVGRVDVLKIKDTTNPKLSSVDLSPILYKPELPSRIQGKCVIPQDHQLENVIDHKLIKLSQDAIYSNKSVEGSFDIANTDRAVGAMLSGIIAKEHGENGLTSSNIKLNFIGSAGQSFGAFAVNGLELILEGDSNDYLGKGLSGGKIVVVPPRNSTFKSSENVIVGNTLLYGATSGHAYICGSASQRFAVRNSGATAVVEGIGDHGCEYMTGGTVLILGDVGRNFAAGMSGGTAFVYDKNNLLDSRCNKQVVEIYNILDNTNESISIKILLDSHIKNTSSQKAKQILLDFDNQIKYFRKVVSPLYEEILKR